MPRIGKIGRIASHVLDEVQLCGGHDRITAVFMKVQAAAESQRLERRKAQAATHAAMVLGRRRF